MTFKVALWSLLDKLFKWHFIGTKIHSKFCYKAKEEKN